MKFPRLLKRCVRNQKFATPRFISSNTIQEIPEKNEEYPQQSSSVRFKQFKEYVDKHNELKDVFHHLPFRIMKQQKDSTLQSLHLICPKIADKVATHVLPIIKTNKNQIICETNAGLGLITSKLLDNGIEYVRMYEVFHEFQTYLRNKFDTSLTRNRTDIYAKDFFSLGKYDYIDRQDGGNRVETLLKNVPQKEWEDDPVMTIIGPMFKLDILRYLLHKLSLNAGIVNYGRIQIFAMMISKRYQTLAAQPGNVLYNDISVLLKLFFDWELLDKFPREMFLPWKTPLKKYEFDPNTVFLVKLNLKKNLPLPQELILPFIYFVKYFSKKRIIPSLEQFWSGCGKNIIVSCKNQNYRDISIWTVLSELEPNEILNIFLEVSKFPLYNSSAFMALVDTQMRRSEETSVNLDESDTKELHKTITEDIEIKYVNK